MLLSTLYPNRCQYYTTPFIILIDTNTTLYIILIDTNATL